MDQDRALITAWRTIASKSTTIEGTVTPDRLFVSRTDLRDLLAAMDRLIEAAGKG